MKVSVIIPTVGRESLDAALNSVRLQSQKAFEIIIVDDSLLQSVISDQHLIVGTGGGRGASFARNLGARRANGEYLAFLDDDDLWLSNKLENQIKALISNDLDILISSAQVNCSIRPAKRHLLKLGQDPLELLYEKPHVLKSRAYLPTSSYIVRKSVFEKISFCEDLVDRENIFFLDACFRSKLRLLQSDDVLVEINYKKEVSLIRMTLQSEQLWFDYLRTKKMKYARNFLVESVRNFMRRKDFAIARNFLASNTTQIFKYHLLHFISRLTSIFR